MQIGNYAIQRQDNYTGTTRADHRLRMAKRAEAKRQRVLDTIQMLAETGFLVAATYAGILLFGAAIAVLG